MTGLDGEVHMDCAVKGDRILSWEDAVYFWVVPCAGSLGKAPPSANEY